VWFNIEHTGLPSCKKMLIKPDIEDEKIAACLQDDYGLEVSQITFLPLGADQAAAVYRVEATDGKPYFLKLRRGSLDETALALTRYLNDQGIKPILPPLVTRSGKLSTEINAFKAILYPFVEGRDGYEAALSDDQWIEFGRAVRSIQAVEVPEAIRSHIRRETYSPRWREMARQYLKAVEESKPEDSVVARLGTCLKANREVLYDLIERAERLAQQVKASAGECVLCHSDLHPGNILVASNGELYIVDWDEAILAPKERDLMFIGSGLGFKGRSEEEQEELFYRGYGETTVDRRALSYYRCERIVEDIAVECRHIASIEENHEERERSLQFLESNFKPGSTIEMANKTDASG
jgi:spectinomycin phosphotransferase